MKQLLHKGLALSRTKTAKSLSWVFIGNGFNIVLTYFTTIIIANNVTVTENGIFLSLFNLANLLSDLGEAGLGSALSNFVPPLLLAHKNQEAKSYVTFGFVLELVIASVIGILLLLFSVPLAHLLFADTPVVNIFLTALLTMILVLFGFSTFILSAYQEFQKLALINISYSIFRLLILVLLLRFLHLSLFSALLVYLVAFILSWLYSLLFIGNKLTAHVEFKKKWHVLSFSRYLGLQRVFISVSSRLDLLMLIPLSSAVEAAKYGIASRFSLVYPLVISALGQVLAPKFAEFASGHKAMGFFKKVLLVVGALVVSQVVFFFCAPLIISILVPKYMASVPVLQALLISMTGFIIATPFISLLIYTFRKPYITSITSVLQLLTILVCNWLFIPKFGSLGPVFGIGISNMLVCIIAIGATYYYYQKEV